MLLVTTLSVVMGLPLLCGAGVSLWARHAARRRASRRAFPRRAWERDCSPSSGLFPYLRGDVLTDPQVVRVLLLVAQTFLSVQPARTDRNVCATKNNATRTTCGSVA